ncbi:hypothetical protein [Pseudomonas peli]|uniref:hypothetical protein n=1 Tax=Pseudomonas peli TaxID=592361 RepID=UPI0024ADB68B|nr:hypothetical protein [Pseudomonas peli]
MVLHAARPQAAIWFYQVRAAAFFNAALSAPVGEEYDMIAAYHNIDYRRRPGSQLQGGLSGSRACGRAGTSPHCPEVSNSAGGVQCAGPGRTSINNSFLEELLRDMHKTFLLSAWHSQRTSPFQGHLRGLQEVQCPTVRLRVLATYRPSRAMPASVPRQPNGYRLDAA